ncbi:MULTISPECIES: YidB family protein [unclassified Bradyrhizobium]|uniref:YidB family protein n=1 Tax=unclassified Bradyrhizobium TaxID=2631580 RepID=UPI0028E55FD8|nr:MULTISPECIES: YidB family protein [unclassified Bradyrhizobium]
MGLLDILNGMQNGPNGPSHPTTQKSGGMSPMTMAILALLAWKAVKHFSQNGQQPNAAPAPVPPPQPTGNQGGPLGGGLSGGLGNIIAGSLGGLLAGGAAGSVLSGGLGDLLRQFQDKGHGDTANSWVSPGENKPISPGDLANALGADQIDQLTAQSGLSRDELLNGLSQYLPKVIDQLTPDGRLPTEHELAGRI